MTALKKAKLVALLLAYFNINVLRLHTSEMINISHKTSKILEYVKTK